MFQTPKHTASSVPAPRARSPHCNGNASLIERTYAAAARRQHGNLHLQLGSVKPPGAAKYDATVPVVAPQRLRVGWGGEFSLQVACSGVVEGTASPGLVSLDLPGLI